MAFPVDETELLSSYLMYELREIAQLFTGLDKLVRINKLVEEAHEYGKRNGISPQDVGRILSLLL